MWYQTGRRVPLPLPKLRPSLHVFTTHEPRSIRWIQIELPSNKTKRERRLLPTRSQTTSSPEAMHQVARRPGLCSDPHYLHGSQHGMMKVDPGRAGMVRMGNGTKSRGFGEVMKTNLEPAQAGCRTRPVRRSASHTGYGHGKNCTELVLDNFPDPGRKMCPKLREPIGQEEC